MIHGARYDRLVAAAKKHGLGPHGFLHRAPIEGYLVDANQDKDGRWSISFVTMDYGHLGYYGYIFADRDPEVNKDFITGRLGEHWWTYHDNTW